MKYFSILTTLVPHDFKMAKVVIYQLFSNDDHGLTLNRMIMTT